MEIAAPHLETSALQRRKQGLLYNRVLYFLVSLEMLVALIWTSFSLHYTKELAQNISQWWEFGVTAAVLVGLLVLITFFVPYTRSLPINWVLYFVFMFCFAHLICFINILDKSRMLYLVLWILTLVIHGFCIYYLCADDYIPVIESFCISFGLATAVLMAYIILTEHKLYLLILVAIGSATVGFYYAYGLRTATRFSVFDYSEEDPVSGAIRFWLDGALVSCRFFENVGKAFRT